MVDSLGDSVDAFKGAGTRVRCFLHILNLVAKSLIRQFDARADKEKAKARMALYLAARDVLGAALRLLSIKPLERM